MALSALSGALLVAVALASGSAAAAPSKADARAEYDRGVAAYTKGDYAVAADAFAKSYASEVDEETLFAWAQTERNLGRCDKAIELYGKLLALDQPAENRQAITVQLEECKQLLAAQKPVEPTHPPIDKAPSPVAQPAPTSEGHAWWKDPIGGALVSVGAVSLGAGLVMFVQAGNAHRDEASAPTYPEYTALHDRAESRWFLGTLATTSGGLLIATGIVWYATRNKPSRPIVSGWLSPSGGGIAIASGF